MPNNEVDKGLIKSSKKWFLYWILSILFFFLIVRILNNNSNSSGLLVLLFLGDVGFGGISFLILLIRVFREKYWELLVISGFVFALFFVILVSGVLTGNNINGVTDKLIACSVGSQCGGGSRQMKESECANSTCCQVGNVWVVMNIDECKLKQQDYATSQRPTTTTVKQPIQVQPIKPIEPPNLCCKESCNSFTGVCTTSCTKQWVCF